MMVAIFLFILVVLAFVGGLLMGGMGRVSKLSDERLPRRPIHLVDDTDYREGR